MTGIVYIYWMVSVLLNIEYLLLKPLPGEFFHSVSWAEHHYQSDDHNLCLNEKNIYDLINFYFLKLKGLCSKNLKTIWGLAACLVL